MSVVRIAPGELPAEWRVRVPGSKSITNRALLLAGVADGVSHVWNPLDSNDSREMAAALGKLGARCAPDVRDDRMTGWRVSGLGGPPTGDHDVHVGMGGTTGRFLLAMLAAGHGRFRVDAHEQLRRRPFGPILDAVRAQGGEVDGSGLPLTMHAHGLSGGDVEVDASLSSQFLSGLLMAAPFARDQTTLRFGASVSAPYLQLTYDVMRAFGAEFEVGDGVVVVESAPYAAADFAVEPDASTASYFLASAALNRTTVELTGLSRAATRQGDIELLDFLERMGCRVQDGASLQLTGPDQLRGIDADMTNSSDVFMTLACLAPFADSPTTITGIGHTRVKESDRIAACAENMRRLEVEVEEGEDWLRIHPGSPRGTRLPTYDDHRVAMAFALIGARVPIELEEPQVVDKSCPEFFELWSHTGADVVVS
jgi:3-phosphoshikimate 1-carboxyvinyltransferase